MKILTFDIEEWFHLLDNNSTRSEREWSAFDSRIHANIDRILKLLDEKNKSATFFCLGWIGEKYPEVIKAIDMAGHEIGSHSHLHQLVYQQSPSEFKEDLRRSLDSLESITGKKISLYRSPGFSITKDCLWAFEIMMDMGIECDCSIFPAPRSHGGIADFPHVEPFNLLVNGRQLKELPMSIYQIGPLKIPFSGGGYFRFFPYDLIKFMSTRNEYLMTYFHPRDFDKDQPLIPGLSTVKRLKSYYGLKGALPKLERLVDENQFISVRQAINAINWAEAPVHPLDTLGKP